MKLNEIKYADSRMPGMGDFETNPDAWRRAGLAAPARPGAKSGYGGDGEREAEDSIQARFDAARAKKYQDSHTFNRELVWPPQQINGKDYNYVVKISGEAGAVKNEVRKFWQQHWGAKKPVINNDDSVVYNEKEDGSLEATIYAYDRHYQGQEPYMH